MSIDNPETHFLVVINQQKQYSIWPSFRPVPGGWQDAGFSGVKQDCLDYIESHWTDMRPAVLQ